MQHVSIPAETAVGVELARHQICRVVNIHGGQVVDTWAFQRSDAGEFLSMAHSRTATYHLEFKPGDTLVSNRFNPMLSFVADTSPGRHDTLHAACSEPSYRYFGAGANHANCQDNLLDTLAGWGFELTHTPCPWNLFENTSIETDLALRDQTSEAPAGSYVELRAEMDLILVCSACPSGIGNISGRQPRGAAVEIEDLTGT